MTDQMLKEWGRYERAVYSSDSGSDPRFAHPITRLLPHTSLLIQPMRWKGETIGGFAIAWVKDIHRVPPAGMRLGGGFAASGGGGAGGLVASGGGQAAGGGAQRAQGLPEPAL